MSSADSKIYPGIARDTGTFGTPDPADPANLVVTTSHSAPYTRRLAVISEATLTTASERFTLHSGQVIERVTQPQQCNGRPCGRVWSFRDHTELVSAGARIDLLTSTDTLTGLSNRGQFAATRCLTLRTSGELRREVRTTVDDLRIDPLVLGISECLVAIHRLLSN